MFNCKKLFKLQIRPQSLILLITTSQDRLIFPCQSWEVRNSATIIGRYNIFPACALGTPRRFNLFSQCLVYMFWFVFVQNIKVKSYSFVLLSFWNLLLVCVMLPIKFFYELHGKLYKWKAHRNWNSVYVCRTILMCTNTLFIHTHTAYIYT